MNNLDLHNRLLQLAKDVERLRKEHPELAHEISLLETHLEGESVVTHVRQQGQFPYRKPGSTS